MRGAGAQGSTAVPAALLLIVLKTVDLKLTREGGRGGGRAAPPPLPLWSSQRAKDLSSRAAINK